MARETESFEPDAERVEVLREIADEIRGDSSESKQVAAILYRVSDLFDPDEDTSPRDIYINMREILRTKDAGGKGR
ncbi:hypothetical protein [Haladaptatus salinisoli]|uniref:hypothetical protein n=1 Tax=Haladaptatus salinisoli TaxID=2884876 RepID=UPI001D0ACE5F|nr:hypothetical protein [Haladaptatus salinisoli]